MMKRGNCESISLSRRQERSFIFAHKSSRVTTEEVTMKPDLHSQETSQGSLSSPQAESFLKSRHFDASPRPMSLYSQTMKSAVNGYPPFRRYGVLAPSLCEALRATQASRQ